MPRGLKCHGAHCGPVSFASSFLLAVVVSWLSQGVWQMRCGYWDKAILHPTGRSIEYKVHNTPFPKRLDARCHHFEVHLMLSLVTSNCPARKKIPIRS